MGDEYDNSMRNRGLPNKPHEFQPQEYARDFCAFQPTPESPRCNLSRMNTVAHSVGDEETAKPQSTTEALEPCSCICHQLITRCARCSGTPCRDGRIGDSSEMILREDAVHVAMSHDRTHGSGYRCYEGEAIADKIAKLPPASTAPVVDTGGFQCSCCGRNMEIRINGEFCNECAGHQSALRRVLRQIVNDLPGKRDWLDPALEQEARELTGCVAAATAAPVEQSDASQSCQRCGRIGGKIVNFNYDSITTSRWICPHCLDADEGAR